MLLVSVPGHLCRGGRGRDRSTKVAPRLDSRWCLGSKDPNTLNRGIRVHIETKDTDTGVHRNSIESMVVAQKLRIQKYIKSGSNGPT